MVRRYLGTGALAILAGGLFAGCGTKQAATDPSFCGRLAAGPDTCAEERPCDAQLFAACGKITESLNPGVEQAAAGCLQSGICSASVCLGRAAGAAQATPAHTALAQAFCATCAPADSGCERAFYLGKDATGASVYPYAEAAAQRVQNECVKADNCAGGFQQCAGGVLRTFGDELLGPEVAKCQRQNLRGEAETPVAFDGGAIVITCSPETCGGCCLTDSCLPGKDKTACGRGGLSCQVCTPDEICRNDRCERPCGPDTCEGCCNAAGDCIPGNETNACGGGGKTCESCKSSFICLDQTCVDGSCKATCQGCCSSTGCEKGDTPKACGVAGQACVDCGAGRACRAAKCILDPTSSWDLEVPFADVPALNKDAGSWDLWGNGPDPFVKVFSQTATGAAKTAQSAYVTDSFVPAWPGVLMSGLASEFLANTQVEVWDSDTIYNDFIGGCKLPINVDMFNGKLFKYTCPATPSGVAFTVYFRLKHKG
jgi:hypothetical protein